MEWCSKSFPARVTKTYLVLTSSTTPLQGVEAARARESGLLTLAGPMELMQGGLGVVGRQPVYLEHDLGRRNF